MRLGGSLFKQYDSPESWVRAVQATGYNAAYCPVTSDVDDVTVRAYGRVAHEADIVIAEVGAWGNPLSPDEKTRKAALEHCQKSLDLADRIEARCCVNIAGSRGTKWDGPCVDDLKEDTFAMIVEMVREIIDAVNPRRSVYTLETMPWMYPDSADSYLRLIEAIGRKAFAVHLDPVNLVCSPQRYFNNSALLHECFAKLGPYVVSCHAKDIILRETLTVHLDEVRPGLGHLDYRVYLRELRMLGRDVPLMLEHMSEEQDYMLAAQYIHTIARNKKGSSDQQR